MLLWLCCFFWVNLFKGCGDVYGSGKFGVQFLACAYRYGCVSVSGNGSGYGEVCGFDCVCCFGYGICCGYVFGNVCG